MSNAPPPENEWRKDEADSTEDFAPLHDGPSRESDFSDSIATDTYWTLSRTPLTSLVFTLPLVLAYEGGVLLLGRGSPRNGADVWLRTLLDHLGFGQYFLLPTLTIIGLLAWHHVAHDRWRWNSGVLVAMTGECVFWAAILMGIARLQDRFWPLMLADGESFVARIIAYCGAGLYEEVLFRLLLLPALSWLVMQFGASPGAATMQAIVVSSLLFSFAHYVGPLGDTFNPYSFTFRFLAGVFFCSPFFPARLRDRGGIPRSVRHARRFGLTRSTLLLPMRGCPYTAGSGRTSTDWRSRSCPPRFRGVCLACYPCDPRRVSSSSRYSPVLSIRS